VFPSHETEAANTEREADRYSINTVPKSCVKQNQQAPYQIQHQDHPHPGQEHSHA
jgi:hypothetical protein